MFKESIIGTVGGAAAGSTFGHFKEGPTVVSIATENGVLDNLGGAEEIIREATLAYGGFGSVLGIAVGFLFWLFFSRHHVN